MNPTCPNCNVPMTLITKPKHPEDQHSFECKHCGVIYMTDDHTPIAGGEVADE